MDGVSGAVDVTRETATAGSCGTGHCSDGNVCVVYSTRQNAHVITISQPARHRSVPVFSWNVWLQFGH
jgi:hypothetical protein